MNALNSKLSTRNTSGERGVSWDKHNHLWQVRIAINSKVKFVGRFQTVAEAARARDIAIADSGIQDAYFGGELSRG